MSAKRYSIIVHGGAGTLSEDGYGPEAAAAFKEKLSEALAAGEAILQANGTSLDAIEAAIRIMENAPMYNAGRGAVLNRDGYCELDSSIMDGNGKRAGAVAGAQRIRNPISAARAVMDRTPHVLIAGPNADQLATELGLETVDPSYFITEHQRARWQKSHDEYVRTNRTAMLTPLEPSGKKFGTVGAVALDRHGNIAAGTSTGGMSFKRPGRIGDSPIIGAGTYADNRFCGVSATGHGEFFIRHAVTHDITALMEYRRLGLAAAVDEVIQKKLKAAGGVGAVIAIDRSGQIVSSHNSKGLFHAARREGGVAVVVVDP